VASTKNIFRRNVPDPIRGHYSHLWQTFFAIVRSLKEQLRKWTIIDGRKSTSEAIDRKHPKQSKYEITGVLEKRRLIGQVLASSSMTTASRRSVGRAFTLKEHHIFSSPSSIGLGLYVLDVYTSRSLSLQESRFWAAMGPSVSAWKERYLIASTNLS
jgi:hypothetical protein